MAFVPVIVGVADIKNKTDLHKEPATLMLEAIHSAIQDSGASKSQVTSQIDSIDVVRTWTWPYADLPGLLSQRLQLASKPKWSHYTATHGGNQPAKLVDEAAGRIARGTSTVAVVTGGEALASLTACAKLGVTEPRGWTKPETPVHDVFSPSTADLGQDIGGMHSIGAPIHVYPLYENAFRAHREQTPRQNHDESATLYADFAAVSAQHTYSWNHAKQPLSKDDIATVSPKNRMICSPYPLLMNAFNTVNLAAACILTSTENAKKLGIPEDKWVYPLGGAGRKEEEQFWRRPNFFQSQAISLALDECLAISDLTIDEIDALDLYSCFPIVPKLACHHLGLPLSPSSKPLTLLGGLTSFGGAGNNYSMHAITEMTRQIRNGKFQNGLVLANGGVLSYQHALSLSSNPRRHDSPYPDSRINSDAVVAGQTPVIETFAEGAAVIETYTVEFDRDGKPETAFIIGRLETTGHRFVANHGDERTLLQISSALEEQVGKKGHVAVERSIGGKPERNLFFLALKPGL
ncbi:hypothetical protein BD289DRAFT_462123 [Coniella lustricola]|uniref:Thiolase-like protein type 1 additional C-terminal domain-containing protein n=1 Tax=Coniella lustricola TaxID=2025994 RepID=A0A2T3A207_9PEZI|nr:hypothetical protein BD289DRAFT_462123 [Coniella lustricola]